MLKKYLSLVFIICFLSGTLAAPLYGAENPASLIPPKHTKIIRSYQKKALKYTDEERLAEIYSPQMDFITEGLPIKFMLDDNWYVLWFKTIRHFKTGSVAYAYEYDNTDQRVGFIKIKRVKKSIFMFYEYRINEERKTARLTHIMLLHNNKHKAAFVFNTAGDIQAYQYDGKIYSLRFAMPGIQPLELKLPKKSVTDVTQDIAKGAATATVGITKTAVEVALSPLGGVAMLVFMVAVITNEIIS